MFHIKTKHNLFILGIISGIILGSTVTFLIYRYNIPVIERIKYIRIPYFSSNKIASSEDSALNHKHKNIKDNNYNEEKYIRKKQKQVFSKSDSALNKMENTLENKLDTVKNINKVDFNVGDKDIVVVKDELITTKEIPLSIDNSANNDAEEKKLSRMLTDNSDDKINNKLLIEFWKSPLNYRGFKMSDNKLIIYGIEETDSAIFFYNNNTLYLEYIDQFYRIRKD